MARICRFNLKNTTMSTKIQWTNETWNPIIGCEKISPGCKNCYAEKMAFRLSKMQSTKEHYGQVINADTKGWNTCINFNESALEKPFKWKKPRMIFVCSMGDLFHESVPFEWVDQVIMVIAKNSQHTFQVLTKRPNRMKEYFESNWQRRILNYHNSKKGFGLCTINGSLPNLWVGVTAENQEQANKRIPILLDIPATIRFVSCEPLLSDIDFPWYQHIQKTNGTLLNYLDWLIAGPETGPKARPMQKEWIENIYQQCKVANVPFFDKKNTLGLNLTQIPE